MDVSKTVRCKLYGTRDYHKKAPFIGMNDHRYQIDASVYRFIAFAVAKIYKPRKEKLCELEAPWFLSSFNYVNY